MVEEVLFKSESTQSRAQIAEYFQQIASNLEQGKPITLKAGADSVTLDPPTNATFEVKAEREGQPEQPGELSIEFEIEWDENGSTEDNQEDLEIQ